MATEKVCGVCGEPMRKGDIIRLGEDGYWDGQGYTTEVQAAKWFDTREAAVAELTHITAWQAAQEQKDT